MIVFMISDVPPGEVLALLDLSFIAELFVSVRASENSPASTISTCWPKPTSGNYGISTAAGQAGPGTLPPGSAAAWPGRSPGPASWPRKPPAPPGRPARISLARQRPKPAREATATDHTAGGPSHAIGA